MDTSSNTVVYSKEPVMKRQVISNDTSKLVRFALESVVANGTGRNAYIENYRVGGKTGTAQKVKNGVYESGNYILSFIGFMPADNPKIVVYVAIDNAKNVSQYGGTASAPVAKNVMNSAISSLKIEPSYDGMPKEYTWLDEKYIKLPNVIGMNVNDAKKLLKSFKLQFSGTGDTVIYTSPKEESYVKENGTVLIMLN